MNKKHIKRLRYLLRHKPMTLFALAFSFCLFALFVAVIVSNASLRASNHSGQTAFSSGSVEDEIGRVDTDRVGDPHVLARIYSRKAENAKAGQAFAEIDLVADAAIVYDINTGTVLFEKHAREPQPLASITKVMTVITAQDILPEGATVTVTPNALATYGESGLLPFESWEFRDIVDLTLITSSNDAAAAIAEAAGVRIEGEGDAAERFVQAMNKKAFEVGMTDAHFKNPTGLDENMETEPGAVASAFDVARLFAYALEEYPRIIKHSRLSDYEFVSLNGREWHVENTNELADALPGLVASKTGYTLQAGGNLAVVVDAGFLKPVAIVVLGSTVEGRFTDVEKLYEGVRTYID